MDMSRVKFRNGQMVKIGGKTSEALRGMVGKIVGVNNDMPVIGISYIIDLGFPLSDIYPFQCISIYEHDLALVP